MTAIINNNKILGLKTLKKKMIEDMNYLLRGHERRVFNIEIFKGKDKIQSYNCDFDSSVSGNFDKTCDIVELLISFIIKESFEESYEKALSKLREGSLISDMIYSKSTIEKIISKDIFECECDSCEYSYTLRAKSVEV